MRKGLFALVLVGAAFAGGALVNGPGARWVRAQILARTGGDPAAPATDDLALVSEDAAPEADPAQPDSAAGPGSDSATSPSAPPLKQVPAAPPPPLVIQAPVKKTDAAANEKPAESEPAPLPLSKADAKDPEPRDEPAPTPADPPPTGPAPASDPGDGAPAPKGPPAEGEPQPLPPLESPATTAKPAKPAEGPWSDAPGSAPAAPVFPHHTKADEAPAVVPAPMPPAGSGSGFDSESTAPPAPESGASGSGSGADRWAEIRRSMRALGVARYSVEGEPGGRVRFRCVIPLAGERAVSQQFEAEGSDEFQAAASALRRVALWKATESP